VSAKWVADRWAWWLALILLTAAALRMPLLDRIPPGFQFDEAYNAIDALRVMQGDRPLFLPANGGREVLYTYLQALAMRVLGANVAALRFTSALLGLLTIAATFFLVRLIWRGLADGVEKWETSSTLLALFTSALMAVTYWHLHFSRYGIRAIALPLLEVLLFYAFWRGLHSRHLAWWVLGGILLGLAPYTHPAGRLLPFIITAFVVYKLAQRNRQNSAPLDQRVIAGSPLRRFVDSAIHSPLLWQWLTMALIAVILFVPLGWYFWHNREAFTGHAELVSIFNPAVSGGNPLGAFARNLWAVLGMFLLRGDGAWNHNLAGRPVWEPLTALFFVVGAGVLLIRLFSRRQDGCFSAAFVAMDEPATAAPPDNASRGSELPRDKYVFWAIWLVVMFMPTLLSSGAPDFSRSIGVLPALCVLPGLGLLAVAEWLPSRRRHLALVTAVGVLAVAACSSVRDYFFVFPREPSLYHLYDVDKLEVARHLRDWAARDQVYLSPLWFEHATVRFLTQGLGLKSFDAGETLVLPSRASGRDALYVFSWEQTPYIESFAERTAPLATRADVPNQRGGKLLVTFRVPAEKLPDPARPLDSLAEAGFWPDSSACSAPHACIRTDAHAAAPLTFGGEVALLAYSLPAAIPAGGAAPVTLYWQALHDLDADYTVFLHVTDARGRRWGQDDRRPNNGGYPTPVWKSGDVVIDRYWPTIDPCAPSGEMRITAGLYLYATGQRLSVDRTGLDVAPLGQLTVVLPEKRTLRDRKPARQLNLSWADLRLLGLDPPPESVVSGDILPFNLYWRALADVSLDYELALKPATDSDAPAIATHSRLVLSKGESTCMHHDHPVLPDTPSGLYTLTLRSSSADAEANLGEVLVEHLPRSFVLPAHLGESKRAPRLDAQFGDHIHLRGYELPGQAQSGRIALHSGQGGSLPITLYWQADGPIATDYTVFVHLLDEGGALRSQRDAPPAGGARPTSGWLPGEVISDTVVLALPADLSPGLYRLAVGLYSPLDGQRLPVALDEAATLPRGVDIVTSAARYVALDARVEVTP